MLVLCTSTPSTSTIERADNVTNKYLFCFTCGSHMCKTFEHRSGASSVLCQTCSVNTFGCFFSLWTENDKLWISVNPPMKLMSGLYTVCLSVCGEINVFLQICSFTLYCH